MNNVKRGGNSKKEPKRKSWEKNFWAWGYLSRNWQNWKAKRKKIEKTKQNKTEENIQILWSNYKSYNIGLMGIPEWEERKGQKKYLKQ